VHYGRHLLPPVTAAPMCLGGGRLLIRERLLKPRHFSLKLSEFRTGRAVNFILFGSADNPMIRTAGSQQLNDRGGDWTSAPRGASLSASRPGP
jgi:hypothetical protein